MSKLDKAIFEVQTSSYAIAIEQVFEFASRGYTPREIIDASGLGWMEGKTPSWEDAVFFLAYAWRKNCSKFPKTNPKPKAVAKAPVAKKARAKTKKGNWRPLKLPTKNQLMSGRA
ncbi:MAG: hypothetical protein OQJ97_18615 [Rhodospirillales bacterium]|nr:hypothetical protein [Rhodospirillales bacterium]